MGSIKRGLLVVIACGLLIAANAAILGTTGTKIVEAQAVQERIGEKLFHLNNLFTDLLNMETGQRGFLLTGDEAYLEPFWRGMEGSMLALQRLQTLFNGDAAALASLAPIADLASRKRAELDRTIGLKREGRANEALALVAAGEGKQYMDALRGGIETLAARETLKRTQLSEETARNVFRLYETAALTTFLVMALILAAALFLRMAIVRLEKQSLEFKEAAVHDPLTGLPNRRYLEDWLEHSLAAARRDKSPLHLVYIDLNGFKRINDRFGHAVGDQVLKLVAKALKKELRLSDFLARIGGDEFVLVLRDLQSDDGVNVLTSRLAARLEQLTLPEGCEGTLGASFGSAAFPRDGERMVDLLLAADERMYAEKQSRSRLYLLKPNQPEPPATPAGNDLSDAPEAAKKSSLGATG